MTRPLIDPDEYRYADQYEQRYLARLYAHPDCRDPAHPGCANCNDTDDNNKES